MFANPVPQPSVLFLEPNHGMPVRQARAYVKRSCVALGAPPDDPETVVSELVTNACAPRGALSYPQLNWEELKGGSWA